MGNKNRSFNAEEGEEVREYILKCLQECGRLTQEALTDMIKEKFPDVDYVSLTHHIVGDLLQEGIIDRNVSYNFSLKKS